MAKFSYQPMFRIKKRALDNSSETSDASTMTTTFGVAAIFNQSIFIKPLSFKIKLNMDKKLDDKLSSFEEKKAHSEETSKSLDARAREVEKKRNELNAGINMLPKDLPAEFYNAVNIAIDSVRDAIAKEAKEISDAAEAARCETNNALYEIKKEQERLSKLVNRFNFIKAIPFVGSYGCKRYNILHNKNELLKGISSATNCYYEQMLYCRNLATNLYKCYATE